MSSAPNPPLAAPVDAVLHWRSFPPAALSGLPPESVLWSERMPGGGHWSWRLRRGTSLL